jgi:rhamnosyltransferase
MNKIDTSIILLTLNAGEKFGELLEAIFNQNYKDFEVIIIDTSSTDNTLKYASNYPVRIFNIKRDEFGHGKTRNMGANLAKGQYVVYLTQDAMPANNNWLANLLINLKKDGVAGVFGRQIPHKSANPLDFFNYNEDYPAERKIISSLNYMQNNVIFSDVNATVKKSVILENPYPEDVLVSEDLGWAIDIIKKNYKIAYEPTAAVIHSHSFNLKNIFKVTFDQGVSFSQIFQHGDSTYLMANSGNRLIRKIKYLVKEHDYVWILVSIVTDAVKFLSVTLGKNYRRLPVFLLNCLSNYKIIGYDNEK